MQGNKIIKVFFISMAALIFYFYASHNSEPKKSEGTEIVETELPANALSTDTTAEDFTKSPYYNDPINIRLRNFDSLPVGSIYQLYDFIKTNNLCALTKYRFSTFDIVKALMTATSEIKNNPEHIDLVGHLISINSPIFKPEGAPLESKNEVALFHYALYLAGIFNDFESRYNASTEDLEKANDLLIELKQSYPDNGAYPFVRAGILAQLNYNEEIIKMEYLEAFEKNKFTSHSAKIDRVLFEKSLTSPVFLQLRMDLSMTIGYANTTAHLSRLQKILKRKDLDFNKKAQDFGIKMMDLSHVPKGASSSWHYDTNSYLIGEYILRSLHHIENPKAKWKSLGFKNLMNPIDEPHPEITSRIHNDLISKCDSPQLEKDVAIIRQDYIDYMKKNGALIDLIN